MSTTPTKSILRAIERLESRIATVTEIKVTGLGWVIFLLFCITINTCGLQEDIQKVVRKDLPPTKVKVKTKSERDNL